MKRYEVYFVTRHRVAVSADTELEAVEWAAEELPEGFHWVLPDEFEESTGDRYDEDRHGPVIRRVD